MSTQPVKGVIRHVKPLLSTNELQARRRVLALYRAWYRYIPEAASDHLIPMTVPQLRAKLREEFNKNRNVKDLRVIDMLVIKSEENLKDISTRLSQLCHIMYKFKDTALPKPNTFLAKFLSGAD